MSTDEPDDDEKMTIIVVAALSKVMPDIAAIAQNLNADWNIVKLESRAGRSRTVTDPDGSQYVEFDEPRATATVEFRGRVHPWLLEFDDDDNVLYDEDDGDDWRAILLNERRRERDRREVQRIIDSDPRASTVPWVDEREIMPQYRLDANTFCLTNEPIRPMTNTERIVWARQRIFTERLREAPDPLNPVVADLLYAGIHSMRERLAILPDTPYVQYLRELYEWSQVPRTGPAPRPPHTVSRMQRVFRSNVIPEFTHKSLRQVFLQKGWHDHPYAMICACRRNSFFEAPGEETLLKEFLYRCANNNRQARKILFDMLSIKQRRTARKYDYFDVVGSEGNYYRIRMWAPHQNVFLLDPKTHAPIRRFCAYLKGSSIHATHIAQKQTLETNEAAFIASANKEDIPELCPINEGYGCGPNGVSAQETMADGEWSFLQMMIRPLHEELIMPEPEELSAKQAEIDRQAPVPVNAESEDWFDLDGDRELIGDVEP
jgi:hypothetical protein